MEYLKDSNHPLEMNTAMSNKNILGWDKIKIRSAISGKQHSGFKDIVIETIQNETYRVKRMKKK